MSDRLSELLRQRALVQEHLDWLSGEIDRAAGKISSVPPPPPSVLPVPPTPVPGVTKIAVSSVVSPPNPPVPGAEVILDKYRVEPRSLQQDVRKGCFLYFAAALVIVALGVTALYFAISSR